jgi:restriction system protein
MSYFWHDLCGSVRDMAARGKRDFDITVGVAQLVMLVVFAMIFVPPLRHVIAGLGVIVMGLILLVALVAAGIALIRRSNKSSCASNGDFVTHSAMLSSRSSTEIKSVETTTDLIGQLRGIDWFQFEKVVALAYRKLGYTVTSRGGANPDGGIDVILEMVGQKSAVQCKHWKAQDVGVRTMREFLGALTASGIQKGIFVTLSGFSADAKEFADANGIELVDQTGLAKLLESASARFDPEVLEILHDKHKYCPKCGAEMKLRRARKGPNQGQQFWGCSNFKTRGCRGKLPYQPRLA